MNKRVLIVVSSDFDIPSGPSNALFHLLRGISKYFNYIYVISTSTVMKSPLNANFYISSYFLPSNVSIMRVPRIERMQTLVYGLSSYKKNIRKYVTKNNTKNL